MGKGQRVVLPGSWVQVLPPWPIASHQREATEPGIREGASRPPHTLH